MAKEQRKFADDGWAFWIEGEDTSNIYLNDWLNPKGNSYVDVAVHIRGVKASKSLHVYVPFSVSRDEIEDVGQQIVVSFRAAHLSTIVVVGFDAEGQLILGQGAMKRLGHNGSDHRHGAAVVFADILHQLLLLMLFPLIFYQLMVEKMEFQVNIHFDIYSHNYNHQI